MQGLLKRVQQAFWGLLLMVLLPVSAQGESLRLAFEHYPPNEYLENGRPAGMNVEIVNAVCRRFDIDPEFLFAPFARALYDVRQGEIDGIFSLFRTAEREKYLYYATEPLGEAVIAVVSRGNSGVRWNGLETLREHSVGFIRGYSLGKELDGMEGVRSTEVTNVEYLFKMLDSGRIDLAVCDLDSLRIIHAQTLTRWPLVVLHELDRRPFYIGFSRTLGDRGRELAEMFGRAIRNIRHGH